MPEIAFLLGDTRAARNDNHTRLPAAFEAAGWSVSLLSQEAVVLEPRGVRLDDRDPERFDLIWLVGMGRLPTFLDRMQLLRLLPQCRFVTAVDALIHRHAKYPWWRRMPETYASADATWLIERLEGGGDWVVKPPAGSFGRDVVRVSPGADGAAAIRRMTDNGRYCLLQRYVPEIVAGEKRTLIAGGRAIGTYRRVPAGGLRANLAAGATAHAAVLDAAEQALVDAVAAELDAEGIGFAAVDTVYPYLMEVNLVNPGGLATLASLYGTDPGAAVVQALVERRGISVGSAPGRPRGRCG